MPGLVLMQTTRAAIQYLRYGRSTIRPPAAAAWPLSAKSDHGCCTSYASHENAAPRASSCACNAARVDADARTTRRRASQCARRAPWAPAHSRLFGHRLSLRRTLARTLAETTPAAWALLAARLVGARRLRETGAGAERRDDRVEPSGRLVLACVACGLVVRLGLHAEPLQHRPRRKRCEKGAESLAVI